MKYGLTKSLTADFTYNTDFAQVEEDQQQVNLTRFSLFFPEKREFFLEGQGHLRTSAVAAQRGGDGSSGTEPDAGPVLQPPDRAQHTGQTVPIEAGGRLTGADRRLSASACSTSRPTSRARRARRPTNFSVVRLKRDILRRSNVGVLSTHRATERRRDRTRCVGVDANLAFFQNVIAQGFWTVAGHRARHRSGADAAAIAATSTTTAIATAPRSST